MGARKLWGTPTYCRAVAIPQTQTPPTYIQSLPSLSHMLHTVHDRSNTMPSPTPHPHREHTDDISMTVPLTSSKSDKTDPSTVKADSSLVISSPMQNNSITDVYMLDMSGNPIRTRTSNSFLMVPSLEGPQGEKV
jgi:hypothetical protein